MDYISKKNAIEDKKISVAIMSSFSILTVQYLVLIYFNLNDTSTGELIQLASKGIVGLFYLFALPSVIRRNKVKFVGLYFISIFIFIVNYVLFIENWIYLKSIIFPFFFICLPSTIYAYSIKNGDILMNVMKKTSNIAFLVGTLIGVLVFMGRLSIGSYSMTLSYYMLLPAIIYMNEFFDNISIKYGVAVGISLVIIFALGSRGAVVCILVFFILKFVRQFVKANNIGTILLYLSIIFICIICFMFFNKIMEYFYYRLLDFRINSRTIQLFLKDGMYLSGRDVIYKDIINEISKKPLTGIGLAGDRRILYGNDAYVHNIFIEIIANYGVVIGLIINIVLLYLLFKSITIKNDNRYKLIIMWISIGFIHLLVSSSYLIDFRFWIYLGVSINLIEDEKHCKSKKEKKNRNGKLSEHSEYLRGTKYGKQITLNWKEINEYDK